MKKGPLPDYEKPPVVETVVGVQFEALPGFGNAHLGGFWKTLDSTEWPAVSDAPRLQPQYERFPESAKWARIGAHLTLTQDPSTRLQIKNKDENRMIQVQNGRLHFNWLGQTGGEYPRFENVRREFTWVLQRFIEFVDREGLGDFRPNQWEVTYVNHIPRGTVWETAKDWGFFQPLGSVPTIDGLVHGEDFTGEWSFVIREQRGRLHIRWQHGLESDPEQEGQEFIRLTLTARGPVEENDDALQPVLAGLDLGRETIVWSFREFMTDEANKHWGLKHVAG